MKESVANAKSISFRVGYVWNWFPKGLLSCLVSKELKAFHIIESLSKDLLYDRRIFVEALNPERANACKPACSFLQKLVRFWIQH